MRQQSPGRSRQLPGSQPGDRLPTEPKGDSKIVGKPTKSDKKKGKQTLVNLFGYTETLKFAHNLKKKINKKIKKYGIKSNDLKQSVEFILDRRF